MKVNIYLQKSNLFQIRRKMPGICLIYLKKVIEIALLAAS